jgi:hypothetical protein
MNFFSKNKIKKIKCKYFIKKDGSINHKNYNNFEFNINGINNFLCLINKSFRFILFISDIFLYNINTNQYISNLLLLDYIQKNSNLKYIINDDIYYYFDKNKDSEDKVLNLLFINEKIEKLKNISILKKLSYHFLFLRLKYNNNISDDDILIEIFYTTYNKLFLKDDIKKKYNIDISIYFPNYKKFYIFLEKEGYVNKFYNQYYKKIINNCKELYLKYIDNNKDELDKYKSIKRKSIYNFNDIDLEDKIDKYVNNNVNKQKIKYKFIELKKKYNI